MTAPHAGLSPAGLRRAARELARRDGDLAAILETHGAPPLWGRPARYATLVHIILEQQVSLASARAVFRALRKEAGRITPRRLLDLGEAGLRRSGLTRQKASYCLRLAEAIEQGDLDLPALTLLDDAAASDRLQRLPGIGPWTAEVYLLMALRRPDIWPAGDLGLAESVRTVKRLPARPSPDRLRRIAEPWRPYRAVAARMLWQSYLARRRRARHTAQGGAEIVATYRVND